MDLERQDMNVFLMGENGDTIQRYFYGDRKAS